MGHPLGESGARNLVTPHNILKNDFPDEKYRLATLCVGFMTPPLPLAKLIRPQPFGPLLQVIVFF